LPRLYAEPALERHYSPTELAKLWGYSPDTIIRWFRDEPGVLPNQVRKLRGKAHIHLRIPESVMLRVHQRRRNR
jgi:AraC-like DNA-binding protein